MPMHEPRDSIRRVQLRRTIGRTRHMRRFSSPSCLPAPARIPDGQWCCSSILSSRRSKLPNRHRRTHLTNRRFASKQTHSKWNLDFGCRGLDNGRNGNRLRIPARLGFRCYRNLGHLSLILIRQIIFPLSMGPNNTKPPFARRQKGVVSEPSPSRPRRRTLVTLHAWVFWLPYHPTLRAFPENFSSGLSADFVHGHSCGAASGSHRLPSSMVGY
jgi:hypothetical protein